MGDREWKRQPGRELIALRICGAVHLPNLYRLPTDRSDGNSDATCTTRIPAISTDHHGVVFDHCICAVDSPVRSALGVHLFLRRLPDHHPVYHHLAGIPNIRLLRGYAYHPRRPGVGSPGPLAGAQPGRHGWGRQDPRVPELVQPVDLDSRIHELINATFLYDVGRGEWPGVVDDAGGRCGREYLAVGECGRNDGAVCVGAVPGEGRRGRISHGALED
jgi:hypothetical protein